MSAERALANTAEWSFREDEGNSTAPIHRVFTGVRIVGGDFSGFKWISKLIDDPSGHIAVNDPAHYDLSPTTILMTISADVDEAFTYGLAEPATAKPNLFSGGSVATFFPPEYQLLDAIIRAPEDTRDECIRLLRTAQATVALGTEAEQLGFSATRVVNEGDEVMPVVGERVTLGDRDLIDMATSYRRESVGVRVPLEDDQ